MKINDPHFNLREIAKQLILLEQHLLETGKYCPDCITKHLLTIEGLADEGQCLDSNRALCGLFDAFRYNAQRWCQMFARGTDPATIGQEVRRVRKKLAQSVLDPDPVGVLTQKPLPTQLAVRNPPVTAAGPFGLTDLLFPAAVGVGLYWLTRRAPRQERY